MYYSKEDDIIYISNPTEKLFMEKDFVDHITKNGTIRYLFSGNWVVHQRLIELNTGKFWLPVRIDNSDWNFSLDLRQKLVQKAYTNFEVVGAVYGAATKQSPLGLQVLVKPNTFFLILRILQIWGNVNFVDDNTDFSTSALASISDGNLLHCKLIYFHSQRIKV